MLTLTPISSFVYLWVTAYAYGCQNLLEANSGILNYDSAVDGPSCRWTLPISYSRCSALTIRIHASEMESDDRRCMGQLFIPTGDGFAPSCTMREGACYLLFDKSAFADDKRVAHSLLDGEGMRCGRKQIYSKNGSVSGDVKAERFDDGDSNEPISFRLSYAYHYCTGDSGKRIQGPKFSSSTAPESSCRGLTAAVIALSLLCACSFAFIAYLRCRSPSIFELRTKKPTQNGNASATEEILCYPPQDGGQNIGNLLYHMGEDQTASTDQQESAYAFAV